jgi:lysophospholipase L1-like esterase
VVAALAATSLVVLTGAAQAGAAKPTYYVSVGDSYSVGYQPGVGATTTSIIDAVGCPDVLPHTAGVHVYPTTTQAAAAEAFITAHRGQIGLITVSIGGNDVTACAAQANPIPCVGTAVTNIETNVTTLATGLRTAAGGAFVDVTAATGAYTPLTTTVTVAPYGTIPQAVARVCTLTWYCQVGNIHATSAGYAFIGKLVTARYATLHPK